MVLLAFSAVRLHALEEAFQSQRASELLWGALVPRSDGDWLTFLLCAVHWMELASLIAVRAHQYLRGDWLSESSALLHEICDAAAWDPKEIANLLTWQRVQLT